MSTKIKQIDSIPLWKDYIQITKPGIIFSNLLGTIAGFLIASKNQTFDLSLISLLIIVTIGTIFVIASSAVFNNIYDSDIDKFMERTKDRALTNGRIGKSQAVLFGFILILAGELILFRFSTVTAGILGMVGFVFYAFVYTVSKRKTVYNTEIGCISGAMPPIIGYTALTNELDSIALILFLFMFFWQPPHFYAIAMRRAEEYKTVGVPMLPGVKGFKRAKIQSVVYSSLMLITSTLLYFNGTLGIWYLLIALVLGLNFVYKASQGLLITEKEAEQNWVKKFFGFSIVYLTLMFFAFMMAPIFQ